MKTTMMPLTIITILAVKNAIEETKVEMNDEFGIALNGMKVAQQEIQDRYQRLIQESEIRIRDEVESVSQTRPLQYL